MISSAPGTIGEEAVSVDSGQVCAALTKNMTPREGERHFLAFSNLYHLSLLLHLSIFF